MVKNFKIKKNDKYGFFSVDPNPNKKELAEFYKNEYFQKNNGSYSNSYSNSEIDYFKIDYLILTHLYLKTFPKSDRKSILDLGCGEGYQSHFFYKNNYEVKCFDFSNSGILNHNPELINFFHKGDLENFLNKENNNYSIIILKNVLEHLISPISVLRQIKNIMNMDTLLYIDVPNDYSSFQDFLIEKGYSKNTWFCPPQHLHYFQFSSMRNLLEGEGFEIVSFQSGYPIEQFLVNEFSNYSNNKSAGKAAHNARVEISNFLVDQGLEEYIKLNESFANLSFGRDIRAMVNRQF